MERTTQRLFQEVRTLEADLLRTLSEATSAEKSSSKTAADIRALRAAAEAEDMLIAQVSTRCTDRTHEECPLLPLSCLFNTPHTILWCGLLP